jgi:hypothetical protein
MAKLVNNREIRQVFMVAENEQLKFNATNGPLIHWNGYDVKAINEELFNALVNLCKLSATASEDVHAESQEAILAIDEFAKSFSDFQTRSAAYDVTCHPSGTQEMWNAFYLVRRAIFEPREFRPIESIDVLLHRQGVSLQQIALMYGFVTADGSREIHKVEEELAEPGKHTGGDWLPPDERKYRDELAKRWSKRTPNHEFLEFGEEPKGRDRKRPEAPESLETLILQRVSVDQIADMKPSLTREEIELKAAEMGVNLPGAQWHRPSAAAAEQAESGVRIPPAGAAESPEQSDNAGSTKEVAAFVRNLKNQNKSADEIAAKVAKKFPGVDVSGILG